MRYDALPITALPAWAKLNGIGFVDVVVQQQPGRGYGLVATRSLSSTTDLEFPLFLSIPQDLVLSREAIEEHCKVDEDLRDLRAAAAMTVSRQEIMLFLLYQLSMASSARTVKFGVSGPWTEYARMLPTSIPVPTTWSESQREMLVGTSLESIVDAKLSALSRQFDGLCEAIRGISWCQKLWLNNHDLGLNDWIHVDALYRSRSLEVPMAGECMIPCIDMVNHSIDANAFYDRPVSGNGLVLSLRPGHKVESGDEITISYGDSKSAAEMLFSYGFIDAALSSTTEVVLNLQPDVDDPLGEAKLFIFKEPPIIKFIENDNGLHWESAFIHLMCLNEEDGLEFRMTQLSDGTAGSLHATFNGADISESAASLEQLTESHPMRDIFRLRCVAVLQDTLQAQIERLYASEEMVQALGELPENLQVAKSAIQLRELETKLLERAFVMMDDQKTSLLQSSIVQQYLGLASAKETDSTESPTSHGHHIDDDFS